MANLLEKILNIIPVSSAKIPFIRSSLGVQIIAHAMGEWNDERYLNCKEAFETNFAKGVRFFEIDLFVTSDKKIVLFHEGHEKRFGLQDNFTEDQFLCARPFGATLLNLNLLAKLLKKYPDAKIITDVKDENISILKNLRDIFISEDLDFSNIVIPQIYHPSEFEFVKNLGFKKVIFTVYRFRKMKNLTARLLKKHPEIIALTVPDKWIEAKNYIKLGKKCSIDIFVHPIESEKRRDELFRKGVSGIYTANLF